MSGAGAGYPFWPTRLPGRGSRRFAGLWALGAGLVSITVMGAIGIATGQPFVFPSLGPTAYLFFATPDAPAARPRNAVLGHLIGALSGYLALTLFGLTALGASVTSGFDLPRAGAAAVSLGLTAGLMVWLNAPHPPAGATTLIVSLGVLHRPDQIAVLMAGVCILTAMGIVFNRLAGIRYPLWATLPPPDPLESKAS